MEKKEGSSLRLNNYRTGKGPWTTAVRNGAEGEKNGKKPGLRRGGQDRDFWEESNSRETKTREAKKQRSTASPGGCKLREKLPPTATKEGERKKKKGTRGLQNKP